jgi:hypothetical protein
MVFICKLWGHQGRKYFTVTVRFVYKKKTFSQQKRSDVEKSNLRFRRESSLYSSVYIS